MNKSILTIFATVAVGAAGISLAVAQGYPATSGSYATAPYPPDTPGNPYRCEPNAARHGMGGGSVN